MAMDVEQARFNMIEQQIRPWQVLDTNILDLFNAVPREAFTEDKNSVLAFADLELSIGHDQTMMSPKVEARMLQSLEISENDNILEIGTGSGFITACLAKIGRHVTSYEYYEDLSLQAQQRLQLQNTPDVDCIIGDVFNHIDSLGKFDVIAVTGSLPESADIFAKHLNTNGRMFCVMGESPAMTAKLFTCVSENNYREEELFETDLPALLTTNKKQVFSF